MKVNCRRPVYRFYLLPTSTMVIRRRTFSLLGPANQRSAGKSLDPSSFATDLDAIRRGNWSSCRAHLRAAAIVLCIVSIACIAWAYDHSPKSQIDHHVSDGQDVPWILIPVRLYPSLIHTYSCPTSRTMISMLIYAPALPHNSHQYPFLPSSPHPALFSAPLRHPSARHLQPHHPLRRELHLNIWRLPNASVDRRTILQRCHLRA